MLREPSHLFYFYLLFSAWGYREEQPVLSEPKDVESRYHHGGEVIYALFTAPPVYAPTNMLCSVLLLLLLLLLLRDAEVEKKNVWCIPSVVVVVGMKRERVFPVCTDSVCCLFRALLYEDDDDNEGTGMNGSDLPFDPVKNLFSLILPSKHSQPGSK